MAVASNGRSVLLPDRHQDPRSHSRAEARSESGLASGPQHLTLIRCLPAVDLSPCGTMGAMSEDRDAFEITFGPAEEMYGPGDEVDVSRVPGVRDEDMVELTRMLPTARLSRRAGSIGKGASGPGASLVIEIAERILNDGASLLAYGAVLFEVIAWLKRRHGKSVNLNDPVTVAAVAAAQSSSLEHELVGSSYIGTVCITGGGPGLGVDARDVWASSFSLADGWALVIFSSPSALILGHVKIPSEYDGNGRVRAPEEIRELFGRQRS